MAFEGLSSRLQEITKKLRGKARITDSDLKEMLREVKLALLEADVNFKVVKTFVKSRVFYFKAFTRVKEYRHKLLRELIPGVFEF